MVKIFAVYDVKSCSYGNPIFQVNRGVALRTFSDACADVNSQLSKHPGDYRLCELGEYDPNLGTFKSHLHPEVIVSAADVVAQFVNTRVAQPVEAGVEVAQ